MADIDRREFAAGAGLLLGLGQQWRGAHFMSHTLWSAWICWMVGLAMAWGARGLQARRAKAWPGATKLNGS